MDTHDESDNYSPVADEEMNETPLSDADPSPAPSSPDASPPRVLGKRKAVKVEEEYLGGGQVFTPDEEEAPEPKRGRMSLRSRKKRNYAEDFLLDEYGEGECIYFLFLPPSRNAGSESTC